MSSIRLFLLDAFDRQGATHGYEVRARAEREHVHQWTDISVGAVYGAIRRLAQEGLLAEVRTEREGHRPERQLFTITEPGRHLLAQLRRSQAREVVVRADPFDFAFSRPDPEHLDDHGAVVEARLAELRALLAEREAFSQRAAPHLTLAEVHVLRHREHLLRADVAWHEELLAAVPAIVADERNRAVTGDGDAPVAAVS